MEIYIYFQKLGVEAKVILVRTGPLNLTVVAHYILCEAEQGYTK